MNEFDHRILALLKQQRERPKKFRPERGFKPEILLAKNIMQMSSTSLGSIPGSTTEIFGGILGDGWDSLPEGRGNSRHCFYDQRLGMGEFKSLKSHRKATTWIWHPYMVLKIGNLAIKKPHLKPWNSFAAILGLGEPLRREEAGRKTATKVQLAELIFFILNSYFHMVIFPNEGISH